MRDLRFLDPDQLSDNEAPPVTGLPSCFRTNGDVAVLFETLELSKARFSWKSFVGNGDAIGHVDGWQQRFSLIT
jgi:hypothetical protein